jgi:hypothetical protein
MIFNYIYMVRGSWNLGEALFTRPKFKNRGFRPDFLPFNCKENGLYTVKFLGLFWGRFGLSNKGLNRVCATSQLGVLFQVDWSEPKKAKFEAKSVSLLTAYNDKKCDKWILRHNKINSLSLKDFQKSAVRFGSVDRSVSVRGSDTHPPIDHSRPQAPPPYLPLPINCKDFQRGFIRLYSMGLVIVISSDFEKGVAQGDL